MSDKQYDSLGYGDLTPEQLDGMDVWDRDVMLDERHRAVGSMLVKRAVAEIRRHRAIEISADRMKQAMSDSAARCRMS